MLKETTDGHCSMKFFFDILKCLVSRGISFPFYMEPLCPYQDQPFCGEASWGKVLTFDKLKRRGQQLVGRCFLCSSVEVMIDHLLVNFPNCKSLWDLILTLVRVK